MYTSLTEETLVYTQSPLDAHKHLTSTWAHSSHWWDWLDIEVKAVRTRQSFSVHDEAHLQSLSESLCQSVNRSINHTNIIRCRAAGFSLCVDLFMHVCALQTFFPHIFDSPCYLRLLVMTSMYSFTFKQLFPLTIISQTVFSIHEWNIWSGRTNSLKCKNIQFNITKEKEKQQILIFEKPGLGNVLHLFLKIKWTVHQF